MEFKKLLSETLHRTRRLSLALMLPFVLFFLGTPEANASHIVGGDVYYTCLGNNQYEVTFALYRDCAGITMPTSLSVTINGCGTSAPNVTLNPGTRFGVEITPVCPDELPNTTCASTGNPLQGTEVYEYTGIITLPSACNDWVIGWTTCCRNGNITNASPNGMYIETHINNTNGICNNSARFTTLPTPYICAGQPFQFNHGAIDIDGDTLIYELINPFDNSPTNLLNMFLPPNQPFVTNPPNGLVFSTNTGQMTFTPAGAQTAVTAIRVYEIRNGDTIGITMRDIQVVVLTNCTNTSVNNTPPTITGNNGVFDTTSQSFVICQCDTLSFVISASDPDGDTLALDPINSNIGNVFGPNNVDINPFYPIPGQFDTVDLYVTVRTCDATGNAFNTPGIYNFVVAITDGACPVPLPAYLGYNLLIPGVEITASDTAICAGIAQDIQLGAITFQPGGLNIPGTYSWTQISGPAVTFSDDTISDPILSVPGSTLPGDSIVLEVGYTTQPDPVTQTTCSTTDRVVISLVNLPLTVTTQASDYLLCQNGAGNQVTFSTGVSGPGVDTINGTYSWGASPVTRLGDLSSTTIGNPTANLAGGRADSLEYYITYTYGVCTGTDTVRLDFGDWEADVSPAIDTICPGDSTQLTASLIGVPSNAACTGQYTVSSIPFAPITPSGPVASAGAQGDELKGPAQPIGFNFEFFCQTMTQFRVASNGFLSFDLVDNGSHCCNGDPIPNGNLPNNFIAFAWEDLDPGSGGSIDYFVSGTAPNRILVVDFNNVSFWNSPGTVDGQIHMYEGSNIIEIHSNAIGSPGAGMTQGIENATGSAGYSVPGRNGVTWSVSTPDAYRFTPVGALNVNYSWAPAFNANPDSTQTTTVTPAGNTTYTVTMTEDGCSMTDTADIVINTTIPVPNITCGTPVNYANDILFFWSGSPGATGWEYSADSGSTWIPQPLGVDSLLLTGYINGQCAQIQVRPTGPSGSCPDNGAAIFTCCTQPCVNPTLINTSASTDLSCFESGDGSISYLGSGGDVGPGYTFTLYDAATGAVVQGPQNTNGPITFSGLDIGSYYSIATDTFGCIAYSDTTTLTQPAPLVGQLDNMVRTSCWNTSDGSATVSAVGGTTPYTFTWSANANSQVGATATNLAMDTYQVYVSDDNGCLDTIDPVNVFGPFAQAPFVTLNTTNSTGCPGNGTATILSVQSLAGDPNPGNPGSLTYNWLDLNANVLGTDVLTLGGLEAGSYVIEVADTNGCTYTDTFQLAGSIVTIDDQTVNNAACNFDNGMIDLDVSGDNSYTFNWSDGQVTEDATGLTAGTYSVTVTGAGGCQDSATFTILGGGVTINPLNVEERVCPGDSTGSIELDVNSYGGTLSFFWTHNGAQVTNLNNLPAGTYYFNTVLVSGTDTLCQEVSPYEFTVQEKAPTPEINVIDCETMEVFAPDNLGGWGEPFTYAWDTGDSTAIITGFTTPGTYTATMTDVEGCTGEVTINVDAPTIDAYIGQPGVTDTSLYQGQVIIVSAGTNTPEAGVTYNWTGAGFADPNSNETVTLADLDTANYIIVVTADNGLCTRMDTLYLEVEPAQFNGLPTAFTPLDNSEGNGVFRPEPNESVRAAYEVLDFRVFNRWGQQLWQAEGDAAVDGWDGTFNGTLQPRDVYIYTFTYREPGSTESKTIRGEVTLLR